MILQEKNFIKHSEYVNFLKKEYNVTHGYANTIVSLSKDDKQVPKDLIVNQYTGKESLLPIYNKLVKKLETFGDDVLIIPKKTTVSIKRKRQFCLIKPATKTRIDLGLKFNDKPTTDRLEHSGPFGTMCTHRVRITNVIDVDKELINWIKEAYDQAG